MTDKPPAHAMYLQSDAHITEPCTIRISTWIDENNQFHTCIERTSDGAMLAASTFPLPSPEIRTALLEGARAANGQGDTADTTGDEVKPQEEAVH